MVKLRYSSYDVVLQEIPNEVSLAFTITGCQLACIGCHSEYLWDKKNGDELTDEKFERIVKKYNGLISSVLFMGGEWESSELISKLRISKSLGLKTALYTGLMSTFTV
jgi:anaerobic ribonucleoside-triphosphate reductase activating protein